MKNSSLSFPVNAFDKEGSNIHSSVYILQVSTRESESPFSEVVLFRDLNTLVKHVCDVAARYFATHTIEGAEENTAYKIFKTFMNSKRYEEAVGQLFKVLNWQEGKHSKVGIRFHWDDHPNIIF